MVRVAVPFIAGILTWQYAASLVPLWIACGVMLILAIFMQYATVITGRQMLRTGILSALMFAAGLWIRHSAEPGNTSIDALAEYRGEITAIVTQAERTEYGSKATLRLVSPQRAHRNIRVISYLRDLDVIPFPGDTLVFDGTLGYIPAASNPYAFDAAQWYQRQGIQLRTFLDNRNTTAYLPCKTLHLQNHSEHLRREVREIFTQYISNPQSRAVVLAMTIGVRDALDESLYAAYASTGTIHVLAISGLHVGIVSVLLFFLTGKVRATDKPLTKVCRMVVLLAGIWTFACIAGLSPSIVRAAFMFSVYLAGTVLRKPVRGLNVLAFSALVFLSIDPYQLNALSFQFSYLALGGIVVFFRPVYCAVPVRSIAGKFVWSTIVLSFAAQIFLLPLLIHYFQQVSVISLFSSLIAVPAAYLILTGAIILLAVQCVSTSLGVLIGQGLDLVTGGLNAAIEGMSALPFSHVSGVYLPVTEVLVLSAVTLMVALRIITRNRQWTFACVAGVAIFSVLHIGQMCIAKPAHIAAIYPHAGQLAIDVISGSTCFTTIDLNAMPKYSAREVAAFRNASSVKHIRTLDDTTLLSSGHIRILDLQATASEAHNTPSRIVIVDAMDSEARQNALLELAADWYVIGTEVGFAMRKAIKHFLSENNQRYHDLREHGAFYLAKQENNSTNEKRRQNNPW